MKQNLEEITKTYEKDKIIDKKPKRKWYHPKNYIGAIVGGVYGGVGTYTLICNPKTQIIISFFGKPNKTKTEEILLSLYKPIIESFNWAYNNIDLVRNLNKFINNSDARTIIFIYTIPIISGLIGIGIEKSIKYGIRKHKNKKTN